MHKMQRISLNIIYDLEVNDIMYSEPMTGRSLYKIYNHSNALYYSMKVYDLDKNSVDEIHSEMTGLNKQLNIPGVFPKYHYLYIENNEAMLLMDWIDGKPLNKMFRKPAKDIHDVKIRLNFIKELCRLLNMIHDKHIFHRDIKPENIIVKNRNTPKNNIGIIDFGLSVLKSKINEGTGGYKSPEQEYATASIGKTSDVFSLGQVCFWMLSGKTFAGQTEDYQSWYNPDYTIDIFGLDSELMENFFSKVLAFDPKNRLQDGYEVIREIEILQRSIT